MQKIERPFPPHWLEKYTENQLERLAIMTMEGRVSDKMAEKYIEREKAKNDRTRMD